MLPNVGRPKTTVPLLQPGGARLVAWLALGRGQAAGGCLAEVRRRQSGGHQQRHGAGEAIRWLPTAKLDARGRAKVNAVLSNVTLYRRMPQRSVPCDPDLYLFLVRHPDVIVNIWEVLGVAQLQLRQTGPDVFREDEKEGTSASLQFLYKTAETHVVYGEWRYTGSVLPRAVTGRCLAVLRSSYVRQADGTCTISNCLDAFVSVEPGAVEMLSRDLLPVDRQDGRHQLRSDGGFCRQPVADGGGEQSRRAAAANRLRTSSRRCGGSLPASRPRSTARRWRPSRPWPPSRGRSITP